MKILCTGGKGFIGTNLVAALKKEGHEVESFDLVDGQNCNNLHELEIYMEDDKDVVFHLANIPDHRTSYKRPNEIIHNNFISTLNVVECCRLYDVKMIFTSSFSVYGNRMTPWYECTTLHANTPYAFAKVISEKMLMQYNRLYGITPIIFRLSNVYGPHQELHKPLQVIPLWLEQIKKGRSLYVAGLNTNRDFTHVDDIVDGLIATISSGLLDYSKHLEIINLCTQRTIYLGAVAEFLSDEEIVFTDLPEHEAENWWGDNSKAKRLLGWEPKKDFWTELKKMKAEALNDAD